MGICCQKQNLTRAGQRVGGRLRSNSKWPVGFAPFAHLSLHFYIWIHDDDEFNRLIHIAKSQIIRAGVFELCPLWMAVGYKRDFEERCFGCIVRCAAAMPRLLRPNPNFRRTPRPFFSWTKLRTGTCNRAPTRVFLHSFKPPPPNSLFWGVPHTQTPQQQKASSPAKKATSTLVVYFFCQFQSSGWLGFSAVGTRKVLQNFDCKSCSPPTKAKSRRFLRFDLTTNSQQKWILKIPYFKYYPQI